MTSTGRSSRDGRRPRPDSARSTADPVQAAAEVWASVVSGLESARYAEVGAQYAKLSALLIQQRTARLPAGAPAGEEWDELSRLAQRALDLLEPLLGAARLLATTPTATATSSPAARRSGRGPAPGSGTRSPIPGSAPTRSAATPSAVTRSAATRFAATGSAMTPPAPRAARKRS